MRKLLVLPGVAVVLSLLASLPLSGGQKEKKEAQDEGKPIPGIGPISGFLKAYTGFKFTEGPCADRSGNVFFSDIPNERIHRIDPTGKLSVFVEKSNSANGLKVNAQGEIVACEMDGAIAAYGPDGKKRRVIADKFEGKRFNAPNDLVIDKEGGIYFTDPQFKAPTPLPQGKTCVYYVTAKGIVARLIDNLPNPNGINLSPDDKTLYVIPTGQADMMAYPVEGPGKIGQGKVFCTLKQPEGKGKGMPGGDGAAVDSRGNLYVTSALGLQVFGPEGKHLGILRLPEQPANVCFGGLYLRNLYVTGRTSVYVAPMEASGRVSPSLR